MLQSVHKVVGFYADPSGWQTQLNEWERDYSRKLEVKASRDHPTQFWSSKAYLMVQAPASFEEAVVNGDLTHAGNYRLTEHVLNARRNPTRRAGLQIAQGVSG